MIKFPPSKRSGHTHAKLLVSGHHPLQMKTKNEVGVMSWISKKTTIPFPDVVAFDAFVNNSVAHEHALLSRVQGAILSDVYLT